MTILSEEEKGRIVFEQVSIAQIISRFKYRIAITWLLVTMEGLIYLAIPLVIGLAINGLLIESYSGLMQLAMLCALLLVVGTARRFYDTRAYGKIYKRMSSELVARERDRNASVSAISARSQLFNEFMEFLEYSIPEISHNFISLGGTLLIIAFMDLRILGVCLAAAGISICIYWLNGDRIFILNRGENDEFEQQVRCISEGGEAEVMDHFHRLMRWRIKLSDLETINYSGVWLALSVALVSSVMLMAGTNNGSVGTAVTMIMYVFSFMESTVAFPLYYQQVVRLREIAGRLK